MKKYSPLILLTVAVVSFRSSAQIELLSSEMTPIGCSYQLRGISNISVIDTTQYGANTTWNYSNLTSSSYVLNIQTLAPSSTPEGSSFPTANICYYESPAIAYRYFRKTNTLMERVGSVNGATIKTYSDPQIEYVFPMSLGAVNSDTWANSQSSFGGTYDLNCIGTGTLILPNGSHQAILTRVRVEEGGTVYKGYYWYDAENGSILMYVLSGGFLGSYSGTYQTTYSHGTLSTEELSTIGKVSFVNPVTDNLHVSVSDLSSGIRAAVYDINGRVIHSANASQNSGAAAFDFDMSSQNSGIYFLRIDNESGEYQTFKFVRN